MESGGSGSATNSHATIAKKHGSYVPVLLWNIEPEDEKRLDIYEVFNEIMNCIMGYYEMPMH